MVEQLCVNISKSLKKPETQLHPVLVISPPPCGSQAAVVEEASAQILWGRLEPGRGSLDLGRASACCFSPGGVGWVRAPVWGGGCLGLGTVCACSDSCLGVSW